MVIQLEKNLCAFVEPEDISSCLEMPAICPYPEAIKFSPCITFSKPIIISCSQMCLFSLQRTGCIQEVYIQQPVKRVLHM
jgi:hypothetical protein